MFVRVFRNIRVNLGCVWIFYQGHVAKVAKRSQGFPKSAFSNFLDKNESTASCHISVKSRIKKHEPWILLYSRLASNAWHIRNLKSRLKLIQKSLTGDISNRPCCTSRETNFCDFLQLNCLPHSTAEENSALICERTFTL